MEKNKKEHGHIGYKIAAVILAVIAWLAVANISDYQTTKEISDIPVTQLNGDVLEELDKIYDVASGDTVDIVVKGRRSVVGALGRNDFIATADLSAMSITNTVPITVEAKSDSVKNEISITCVDNTMRLNLEEKVTQQFPLKVETTGSPKNGFAVSSSSSTPNIVKIEGPKSAVEKITDVKALVDVTAKDASFDTSAQIKIYDAYGDEIKNDKITLDTEIVKVNVEIYATKSVEISVNLRGTPGDGYGVEGVVFQPQTVELVGPEDALAKVENIDINDQSVSGMTEDFQLNVDIRDYLPDGVSVVNMPPEITINVSVTELEDKKLTVTDSSIVLEKQNSEYDYELTLNSYTITVSGFSDVVAPLTISDVLPTIDCSSLPVGNHGNVTVKLKEIDGVTYEVSGTVSVNVPQKPR